MRDVNKSIMCRTFSANDIKRLHYFIVSYHFTEIIVWMPRPEIKWSLKSLATWKRLHKGLLNIDSMSWIELCVYNRDKSWPRMPIGQYRKLKKCFIQICGDSYHGRGCDSYHGRSDCNRRLKCWWSGIPILPTLRILWDTEIGLFRFLFLNFYYSGHQLLVGGNEVLFFGSE